MLIVSIVFGQEQGSWSLGRHGDSLANAWYGHGEVCGYAIAIVIAITVAIEITMAEVKCDGDADNEDSRDKTKDKDNGDCEGQIPVR